MTHRAPPPGPSLPAHDSDPAETEDWLLALQDVVRTDGQARGRYLLKRLEEQAQQLGILAHIPPYSAYRNTIALEQQGRYPGDEALEQRIAAVVRWNALAMVVRANQAYGELGGHIGSFASAAEIFETGFNHFFRGGDDGDLVFFQPHSAPGVYARAFLEGRLDESQLLRYRQEVGGGGLSSYPHPWLMPDFWQFPTGSMGLGPISAIYQARFMRYLADRGLLDTSARHVWGIWGDGEMDEPESIGALTLAARERLDNLTFIVNCNLQRLDGPVRGNHQIIQELESLFAGAGWNVIKVLWGSEWDALFARDHSHALLRAFSETPDGEYQTLGAKDGRYNFERFFGRDPALRELVSHLSEAQIDALKRGGHDLRKLHAAMRAARAHEGQPSVILAKTKKGYGMGAAGESRMTVHQQKKLDLDALRSFRNRFDLPLADDDLAQLRLLRLPEGSAELAYLRERRAALGGALPRRRGRAEPVPVPPRERWAAFALQADGKPMSTTMGFVRMLGNLLHDAALGPRIVPIVADEARTFGMASLFRQIGIYSPVGQTYEAEDQGSMLTYREARDGQLLEEGITEAGALASWTAAATAYSTHGMAMLPVYIYYSMFGFQRVGDLIWAAADQRARGLLVGATAGRTTLAGEGLQHQDGASHLAASTVPNCRAWDPSTAGELAVIVDHALRRMLEQQVDEFHYLTVGNENLPMPSLPAGADADVVRGMVRVGRFGPAAGAPALRLLGAGPLRFEVEAAAQMLADDWGLASEVYSVTSFSELAREAREAARWNRLHPTAPPRVPHVAALLAGDAPVVAASDYVVAVPQQIAPYLDAPLTVLGTDGFGRSDTRAALRRFFEVDRAQLVVAALHALARRGGIDAERVEQAIERYGIDRDAGAPWGR